MGHWRLNLGYVCPTVLTNSKEFHKLLPSGAELSAVTTGVEELTETNLSAARDEMVGAAKRLDDRGVDCIIAAGTPMYALAGADAEEEILADVRSKVQAPFTTSLRAQVDALRAVSAESLVVVTPYPEDRNDERRAYLEAHGFDVAEIGGISNRSIKHILDVHPSGFYRKARELGAANPDADAIYISCAVLRVVDYIRPLEEDLGLPVVTSTQAQVWKSFDLAGVNPEVTGYGELFEVDHDGEQPRQRGTESIA